MQQQIGICNLFVLGIMDIDILSLVDTLEKLHATHYGIILPDTGTLDVHRTHTLLP